MRGGKSKEVEGGWLYYNVIGFIRFRPYPVYMEQEISGELFPNIFSSNDRSILVVQTKLEQVSTYKISRVLFYYP